MGDRHGDPTVSAGRESQEGRQKEKDKKKKEKGTRRTTWGEEDRIATGLYGIITHTVRGWGGYRWTSWMLFVLSFSSFILTFWIDRWRDVQADPTQTDHSRRARNPAGEQDPEGEEKKKKRNPGGGKV